MRNLRGVCGVGPVHGGWVDSITRLARCGLTAALLGLVVFPDTGLAQSGTLKKSPTEIVRRYVLLDQKGARLDATSFETLVPYINWTEEPAWSRVVIIRDADIPEDYRKWEVINNLEVVIPVTFRVLGSVHMETASFVPEETTEEVRFHVKAMHNYWRIIAPVIPPHIGLKRMVNFVREAGIRESDEAQRSMLATLESSLRKAK